MEQRRTLLGMVRSIRRSQRRVTVLFTDVQDSTEYWDRKGDVAGRLMVDQHNRLIFPLIRRFRGRVLKTIGDSVMASFRVPRNAVHAAIAIQQALAILRERDATFQTHVRIGIHSGRALVERNDVYGAVVNVAARIESRAGGDEILLSAATARGLRRKELGLEPAGSFTPRGSRKAIELHRARWQECAKLVGDLPEKGFLAVHGRQRGELAGCALVSAAALAFVYDRYLRYLIADSEPLALLNLDPRSVLNVDPAAAALAALLVFGLVGAIGWLRRVPEALLQAVHGGLCFALCFGALWLAAPWGLDWVGLDAELELYRSRHLFVEVLLDGTALHETPSTRSPVLRQADAGALLLLTSVEQRGKVTWNRVRLDGGRHGFVLRVAPARVGAPAMRISRTYAFTFSLLDLAAWVGGLLGFLFGALRFRVRPV
jgi:class 3 adenylate cyclase